MSRSDIAASWRGSLAEHVELFWCCESLDTLYFSNHSFIQDRAYRLTQRNVDTKQECLLRRQVHCPPSHIQRAQEPPHHNMAPRQDV